MSRIESNPNVQNKILISMNSIKHILIIINRLNVSKFYWYQKIDGKNLEKANVQSSHIGLPLAVVERNTKQPLSTNKKVVNDLISSAKWASSAKNCTLARTKL